MKKSLKKLKPCPFCAGEARMVFHAPTAYVRCRECGAEIVAWDYDEYGESIDKVIEAWNKRTKRRANNENA